MSAILLRAIYLSMVFASGVLIGEMYTPEIVSVVTSITERSVSSEESPANSNPREDAEKKPKQRKIYRAKV